MIKNYNNKEIKVLMEYNYIRSKSTEKTTKIRKMIKFVNM